MKHRKTTIKHNAELSGSLQSGDGEDPRYDVRSSFSSSNKFDRKAAQLCSQIRRALEFIIPEVLQDSDWDAVVLDVRPAPNTGHLLVLLQAIEDLDGDRCQQLEAAVFRRVGQIRTAVAGSIQRRKVPTLTFRVVPS
ncbi:MAG: hypothetical protein ACK5PZ_13410 [Pirellula sp.]|jgi:ribosome-binding factor A